MKRAKHYEFDVVPPVVPLVISHSLQPEEVEMAIATGGKLLQNHTMRALVEALVACTDLRTDLRDPVE
jgi:hypothetical protein